MLPSQRALFDIPREICYLNAASWSPLPIATQEAGRVGVARKGRPWSIDPALPERQFGTIHLKDQRRLPPCLKGVPNAGGEQEGYLPSAGAV